MRKPFRLAMIGHAERALAAPWPTLRRVPKVPADRLPVPGEVQFHELRPDGLHALVAWVPDAQRDAFTVEVGWSIDGDFSVASMRPSLHADNLVPTAPHGFVRLTALTGARHDRWWDAMPFDAQDPASVRRLMRFMATAPTAAQAEAAMAPLVDDAVALLLREAPVFFDRTAAALRQPAAS